ncbi:SAF domain-containing protein [Ferrimicrobium acidiphilum]|uniref:SAF domain-containing protein n=1 Tax=Ferrimicrobium acidiphilum TaxID=121039 RepID=UPI0023F1174A|nr:SAF domain-containing protein [Ferrimicrobium acidiphilum]
MLRRNVATLDDGKSAKTTPPAQARPQADERRIEKKVRVGVRQKTTTTKRRYTMGALGVLLIVGGAATADLVVQKHSIAVEVIETTVPIAQGQVIQMSELQPAHIKGTGFQGIAGADVSQVVGRIASTNIPAGSLLVPADLASGVVKSNMRVIGALLVPGAYPINGLLPGEYVDAIYAPTSPGTNLQTLEPGSTIASGIQVLDTSILAQASGGNATFEVSLLVPASRAGLVTQAASEHAISLILSKPKANGYVYLSNGQPGALGGVAGNSPSKGAFPTPTEVPPVSK